MVFIPVKFSHGRGIYGLDNLDLLHPFSRPPLTALVLLTLVLPLLYKPFIKNWYYYRI